jgi:hypothetical protein
LNEACCYGDDNTDLCSVGICAPKVEVSDETPIEEFPCVCSETICVKNVEYCPEGAVCDQSSTPLEACGQEGDPCCSGMSCDEDVNLSDDEEDGVYIDLLCNQNYFNQENGQSTRCERPPEILDQSFDGCGNAFEKCCSGDRCDDEEFVCRCMDPIL